MKKLPKMMHKIKRVLGLMKSSPASLADIFENDPQCVKYNGDIECQTNGANSYGTFEEGTDLTQSEQLSIHLMDALRSVREKLLQCEMLIPCGLIMKVSHDIIRMSHSEPCGIRGCVLYINLEEKDKCQHLIKLPLNPSTVSTFELHLTLKEDVRSVCHIKKFFLTVSGCLQQNPSSWNFNWRILCSGFTLEKKKLYRLQS